jgi:small-conductance mechanosensitive channel
MQIAEEHEDILAHPPPDAQFTGFGPHALEFKLGAWTGRPERGGSIRSEMCVRIYKVLREENIEIPYPQSTLHVRSVAAGAAQALRGEPQQHRQRYAQADLEGATPRADRVVRARKTRPVGS